MKDTVENMLSIHLTDLCNNKCRFCVVDSPSLHENKVFKERISSFLQENQNQGYEGVNLHGGEPTTRKDFFEILSIIKECGYPRIILQTNGRKFSKMDYTQKAVALGITKFVVSVHGSKPGIHDYITRIPGSLKHTIKGIKNMKALGIHVRTNSVLSKLNDKDLPDIMKLVLRLGVDHINISAVHTAGSALRNFDRVVPRYTDIYPYLKESVDLVTGAGVELTLEGFPFCMIPGMEKYIVNWETQKFKMLWRDLVLDDYESYMDDEMRLHGKLCADCHQKNVCGGVYNEYIDKVGWDEFGYQKKSRETHRKTRKEAAMRLINKNDHEMLTAIKLSFKMTGKDKMSDYFKKKIEAGENPADAWFYYGLNAWVIMNSTTQSLEKHYFLLETLRGFQEACELEEKHWPAIFLRSLIRLMMEGDEVDDMVAYVLPGDYTAADAHNDLDKLLRFQKDIKPMPYFFVTYTCLANRMLDLDQFEQAMRYVKEGITNTPRGRAPYLDSLLSMPVILLYNKLIQLKHLKLAQRVKERCDILFPGN